MSLLVRLPTLLGSKYPVSRSTLYSDVRSGRFPPPVNLGPRSVAWIEQEVDAIVQARVGGAGDEVIRLLVEELVAARLATDPSARRQQAVATTMRSSQ